MRFRIARIYRWNKFFGNRIDMRIACTTLYDYSRVLSSGSREIPVAEGWKTAKASSSGILLLQSPRTRITRIPLARLFLFAFSKFLSQSHSIAGFFLPAAVQNVTKPLPISLPLRGFIYEDIRRNVNRGKIEGKIERDRAISERLIGAGCARFSWKHRSIH